MSKNKKETFSYDQIFKDALKDIVKESYGIEEPLNVIDFAEKLCKETLYPSQKIILKFFYGGTRFNEDLKINNEDLEEIKSWDIDQYWVFRGEKNKLEIFEKNLKDKNSWFSDLVLILGRRSGKSYLSALIACYEAYKLICLKDPQKFYGINADIWIVNTAINGEQAKNIIFKEITKFIHNCPIFDGRVTKELDDIMYIMTDADLEKNKKIKDNGGRPLQGSIVIASGNSNSAALRGNSCICIIYDEMAHYVDTSGKASAEEVYAALEPSTLTFKPFGDGRNVVISSPDTPQGFFYKHYESSKNLSGTMMFQIPSWCANPTFEPHLFKDNFEKDPDRANAEYGARFRSIAGDAFFPLQKIEEAFSKRENWYKEKKRRGNFEHYLHIDPATNSDRYAYMVCHKERRMDPKTRAFIDYIVEDFSDFFVPPQNGFIDPDEIVDNHILPLFKIFNIVSVTFDNMFSIEQQKKFIERGIFFRKLSFSGSSKNEIYETLKDYLIQGRIELCQDDLQLKEEMKCILVNYSGPKPKINKDRNSDTPYDDLVDCLGGIIHSIITGSQGRTRLPRSSVVRMGIR